MRRTMNPHDLDDDDHDGDAHDPLDPALRVALRALAPPAPDGAGAHAHVRRAIRMQVAEVVSRRARRRRRWLLAAPALGLAVAGAAAASIVVTWQGPPSAARPGPTATAGIATPAIPAATASRSEDATAPGGLAAPLDDREARALHAVLAAPDHDDDDRGDDPFAEPSVDGDGDRDGDGDGDLLDDATEDLALAPASRDDDHAAASLAIDDLDLGTLARVADALKGS